MVSYASIVWSMLATITRPRSLSLPLTAQQRALRCWPAATGRGATAAAAAALGCSTWLARRRRSHPPPWPPAAPPTPPGPRCASVWPFPLLPPACSPLLPPACSPPLLGPLLLLLLLGPLLLPPAAPGLSGGPVVVGWWWVRCAAAMAARGASQRCSLPLAAPATALAGFFSRHCRPRAAPGSV